MELTDKLEILADAAKYDASCASSGAPRRDSIGKDGFGATTGMGICHSYTPDGRCVSLLKILLTNYCLYDCQYCVNRRTSNVPRARFTVAEVVKLTTDFYLRNYIDGLFLSSGIIQSADYTMEQLVQVARELREVHQFRGYIHLKTIPDADPALIAQAGRYADRLSVNIELPTQDSVEKLAPEKSVHTIKLAMGSIRRKLDEKAAEPKSPRFAPAGQSTQMIVGRTPATTRKSCPPLKRCTAATSSNACITRPSAPSRTARKACRWRRRPCCANTACTKPISYCAAMDSRPANCCRQKAVIWRWISIPSWPGRWRTASIFRWT